MAKKSAPADKGPQKSGAHGPEPDFQSQLQLVLAKPHKLRGDVGSDDVDNMRKLSSNTQIVKTSHGTVARNFGDFAFELDEVDVIAPSQSVKELFKLPYSDGPVSQLVYRLGRTLFMDNLDPAAMGLKPGSPTTPTKAPHASWKSIIASSHVPQLTNREAKKLDLISTKGRKKSPSYADVTRRRAHHGASAKSQPYSKETALVATNPGQNKARHAASSGTNDGGRHSAPTGSHTTSSPKSPTTEPIHTRSPRENFAIVPFRQVVDWNFNGRRMILGSNLHIVEGTLRQLYQHQAQSGAAYHSASASSTGHVDLDAPTTVAVAFRDVNAPAAPVDTLDFYLDARMADVAHVALCYHDGGRVTSYRVMAIDDVPTLFALGPNVTPSPSPASSRGPESAFAKPSEPARATSAPSRSFTPRMFSTEVVEHNGETILRFLAEHTGPAASQPAQQHGLAGSSGYWLYREAGSGPVRLYDLASIASTQRHKGWKYKMAMMCYRYAMKSKTPEKLYQNWTPRQQPHLWSFISETRQKLLVKCLDFLTELSADGAEVEKYATIKASVQEQLADLRVAQVMAAGIDHCPQLIQSNSTSASNAVEGNRKAATADKSVRTHDSDTVALSETSSSSQGRRVQQSRPSHANDGVEWKARLCGLQAAICHLVQAVAMMQKTKFGLESQLSCYQAKLADCYMLLAVELQAINNEQDRDVHIACGAAERADVAQRQTLAPLAGGLDCLERSLLERRKMRELLVDQGSQVSSIFTASDELEFNSHFLRVAGELLFKLASRASMGLLDDVLLGGSPINSTSSSDQNDRADCFAIFESILERPDLCHWTTTEYQSQLSNHKVWSRFEKLDRMLNDMIPEESLEGDGRNIVAIAAGLSQTDHEESKATGERNNKKAHKKTVTEQATVNGPPTKDAHPLLPRYRTVDALLQRSINCFSAAALWQSRHHNCTKQHNAHESPAAEDTSTVPTHKQTPAGRKVDILDATDDAEKSKPTLADDEEYVSLKKKAAFAMNERARFQLGLGRFAEAIRSFTRAAEIFEAVSDPYNLAVAYCNLAHCFKKMATAPDLTGNAGAKMLSLKQRSHYESAVEFCHRGLRTLAAASAANAAFAAVSKSQDLAAGHNNHKDASKFRELIAIRRKLHEEEAMICLIHGVRLGRDCASAPLKHRLQFPKWCGRGGEMKAIQLLQASLDLYISMGREDAEKQKQSQSATNAKSRRPGKQPEPILTKQIAAVHYQLGLLYRQLFHRETHTDANGVPKMQPDVDAPPALLNKERQSMPVQIMVQNALKHYRQSLRYFGNIAASLPVDNPDYSMIFLIHRDTAALHVAAACYALEQSTLSQRTSGPDHGSAVAMADLVRALDEVTEVVPFFRKCVQSSGLVAVVADQLQSVWKILNFSLRTIVKIGQTSKLAVPKKQKQLLTDEQAKLFRMMYLQTLQCEFGRQANSSSPFVDTNSELLECSVKDAIKVLDNVGKSVRSLSWGGRE